MTKVNIGERIRMVREHAGLSQMEFARRLGTNPTIISRWETGKSRPRRSALLRIAQEFGVSLDWLLTGNGPMWAEAPETSVEEGRTERSRDIVFLPLPEYLERFLKIKPHLLPRRLSVAAETDITRYIPVIEGYVGAGGSGFVDKHEIIDALPVPRYATIGWIDPFAIKVGPNQDSMSPTIEPGDLVIVSNERVIQNGKMYLIRNPQDDGLTIKRIRVSQGKLSLYGDNPAYPEEEVSKEMLEELIVGRIVAILKFT